MKLAIVTDSTCDLSAQTLADLGVVRVPLYVHFKGNTYKDWEEITPKELIAGVQSGAGILGMPRTSQPSPQDFKDAFSQAVAGGADRILCITISAELSGTYGSAILAQKEAGVPVDVFDSRAASLGVGMMVRRAAEMRDAKRSIGDITSELKRIRDNHMVRFTVAGLDFLQRGGRIGKAQALLGGLLNIKPLLAVKDGRIEPAGKARGAKKALKEIVGAVQAFAATHPGTLLVHFLHVQDPEAANTLRGELGAAGVDFIDAGSYEIGAVIASHVGPGTYGVYLYPLP
jgi:DegV family protein with EDD domain